MKKQYIKIKKEPFDFQFFIAFLLLLLIGLFMLFSASTEAARAKYGDSLYFIKRQLIWAIIGGGLMWVATNIKISVVKNMTNWAFIISLLLLVAVLFIGKDFNGGRRWIVLAGVSFQPSEILKITIVLFLAKCLSNDSKSIKKFWQIEL